MVVDDVVVPGAEPLFVLDYLAVGRVDPERVAAIVAGVAEGCRLARCALLGGETAEHPDAMDPDAYDLAGFALGVVERDRLLGPDRVAAGDVLLGLAALRPARQRLQPARRVLDRGTATSATSPSSAARSARPAHPDPDLRPSPGRPARHRHRGPRPLPRHRRRPPRQPPPAAPPGLTARVDRASWEVPPIFQVLADLGPVTDEEPRPGDQPRRRHGGRPAAEEADRRRRSSDREVPSWVMGEVSRQVTGAVDSGEPPTPAWATLP